MARLIEPGIIAPPRGMAERMAAHRLGLGDERGAPRHFRPGLGFWDAGGVPTDGPDGWYRPVEDAHFTTLGLNTPDILLLCQEASGNLVPTIDSLGVGNWTAGAGALLYQQTVTGWTSKSVGADGTANDQRWATTSSALDLAAGESYAVLAYCSYTTPGATRNLFACQGSANRVLALTAGTARFVNNNVNATTSADHSGLTTMRMIGWYRRGDTNASGGETDLESVANTHDETARTGDAHTFGAISTITAPPECRFNWIAIWKGTNAEFSMSSYITTLKH